MDLCKCALLFLLLAVGVPPFQCSYEVNAGESEAHCKYMNESIPPEEVEFTLQKFSSSSPSELEALRKKCRVCLPAPCNHIEAYSGFISVDRYSTGEDNTVLFYLYIKTKASKKPEEKKPLLLWLQGGPGKSSLFGEFLENGPLGIDSTGKLYYRNHTLLNHADLLYLDQPAGSGYSFVRKGQLSGKLAQASRHIARFLHRFTFLYSECRGRDFFIAGESYGARFAIGAAMKIMYGDPVRPPLHLKGVMLGVGFLFPLLRIIDSSEYLYYTGLLDEDGKTQFAQRLCDIQDLVEAGNYTGAGYLLSQTVLNLRTPGSKSLFEMLTGFRHHGSIIRPERNQESLAYYRYANSTAFKKRIHVPSWWTLDGTRPLVAAALAAEDFFVDRKEVLQFILNNRHTLIYTAQLDDVFPAVNIERELKNFDWRGSEMFRKAKRTLWHKEDKDFPELFGYLKEAGTMMFANVLFGGHYVSVDRSYAVSELYDRFFKFQKMPPRNNTDRPSC